MDSIQIREGVSVAQLRRRALKVRPTKLTIENVYRYTRYGAAAITPICLPESPAR